MLGDPDCTLELLIEIEVRPQDTSVSSGGPKHTRLESTHVCAPDELESPASLVLLEEYVHVGNVQAEKPSVTTRDMTEICTIAVYGSTRHC